LHKNIQGSSGWESIKGNLDLLPKIMSFFLLSHLPAKLDEQRGNQRIPRGLVKFFYIFTYTLKNYSKLITDVDLK